MTTTLRTLGSTIDVNSTMEDREAVLMEELYFFKALVDQESELIEKAKDLLATIPPEKAALGHWIENSMRAKVQPRGILRAVWTDDVNLYNLGDLRWFTENPVDFMGETPSDIINAWTLLFLLSEEARRIIRDKSYSESRRVDAAHGVYDVDTRDLHGWYISADTGRRSVTGWVTAGRGKTLHITPDPMSGISPESLVETAADVVSMVVKSEDQFVKGEKFKGSVVIHDTRGVEQIVQSSQSSGLAVKSEESEPKTFRVDKASITLRLPPMVASERKRWVVGAISLGKTLLSNAEKITEQWQEWHKECAPAITKRNKVEKFTPTLPSNGNFTESWRWARGGPEMAALAAKTWGTDELKQLLIDEFALANNATLSADELLALSKAPAFGAPTVRATLRNILKEDHPTALIPEF